MIDTQPYNIKQRLRNLKQEPFITLAAYYSANEAEMLEFAKQLKVIMSQANRNDNQDSRDAVTTIRASIEVRSEYNDHLEKLIRTAIISYECGRMRKDLTDKYSCSSDKATVNIFFTSARSCEACQGRPRIFSTYCRPILFGAASGVPALRNYLLCKTGESRLESEQRHARGPILLSYKAVERIAHATAVEDNLTKIDILHSELLDEWQSRIGFTLNTDISADLEDKRIKMTESYRRPQLKTNRLHTLCEGWDIKLDRYSYDSICQSGGKTGLTDDENWIRCVSRELAIDHMWWLPECTHLMKQLVLVLEQDLRDRDEQIRGTLSSLTLDSATVDNATFDWEICRTRTEAAIADFRAEAIDAIRKIHEALTDAEGVASRAAVAQVMKPILDGAGFSSSTEVTCRIASLQFLGDVAAVWERETKEKLHKLVRTLSNELLDISKTWHGWIKLLEASSHKGCKDFEDVREKFRARLPELRDIVNEIGRTVLLEETMVPELDSNVQMQL